MFIYKTLRKQEIDFHALPLDHVWGLIVISQSVPLKGECPPPPLSTCCFSGGAQSRIRSIHVTLQNKKKLRSDFKDTGIYCTSMQTVLWNGNFKCWFSFVSSFRLLILFKNFETARPVKQYVCYVPVSSTRQLQDVFRSHHTDLVVIKLHPLICHTHTTQMSETQTHTLDNA